MVDYDDVADVGDRQELNTDRIGAYLAVLELTKNRETHVNANATRLIVSSRLYTPYLIL